MPSVTDVQQQQQQQSGASNNAEKSIAPTTQQTTSADSSNADPLTQAILLLDKKQRNLGKRKEKLESYRAQEREGKELNKDQKDALAKYSDVLGQIEAFKELNEQFKKIQIETTRNQKRLSKQVAEEKRQSLSQSLRQYAQIRYLLEHRPTSLQAEESSLLDQLSAVVVPSDNSADSISRSVDTVLSIYQNGPAATVKNLTGKNPTEVREILEQLSNKSDVPQQQQQEEEVEEEEEEQQVQTPPSSAVEQEPEAEPSKEVEQTNAIPLPARISNDYPLQFDTRNQTIPLEQIIQDATFFPTDLNSQLVEDNRDQSPDPNQYLQTMTVVNSNINDQPLPAAENQQQVQEPSQQNRGRGGGNRGGQYHNGNKNYNRRGSNQYYQQYRGPRGGGQYENSYGGGGHYDNSYGGGGHYDNSYGGGGQRPYSEHNRGRGGYRGNRGGNYRPYNNNNGNGYQNSAQYQNVRSAAPPSEEQ